MALLRSAKTNALIRDLPQRTAVNLCNSVGEALAPFELFALCYCCPHAVNHRQMRVAAVFRGAHPDNNVHLAAFHQEPSVAACRIKGADRGEHVTVHWNGFRLPQQHMHVEAAVQQTGIDRCAFLLAFDHALGKHPQKDLRKRRITGRGRFGCLLFSVRHDGVWVIDDLDRHGFELFHHAAEVGGFFQH